jgi:3-mercaptopyruvate sulfurtransferase SseA
MITVKKLLTFSLIVLGSARCTTPPTVIKDNPSRQVGVAAGLNLPIVISVTTVIVDARPLFEYSTFHIPKSVPLNWSDFSEREFSQHGLLQSDREDITRRLARKGIGPKTHVVVLGPGLSGEGEEGRIAWMLVYLGLDNVQFANFDSLSVRGTNNVETSSIEAVPTWSPDVLQSLDVTRDELVNALKRNGTKAPLSYHSQTGILYKVIDVRDANSYLKNSVPVPSMDSINIPWKEFFDKSMHVRRDISTKLKKVGVAPDQRIVVIGQDGVSSGAVTLALRALGFSNAGNFSGGFDDLLSGF